jgi:hypothetical protein
MYQSPRIHRGVHIHHSLKSSQIADAVRNAATQLISRQEQVTAAATQQPSSSAAMCQSPRTHRGEHIQHSQQSSQIANAVRNAAAQLISRQVQPTAAPHSSRRQAQ